MRAMGEVVEQLGLEWEAIEPYGRDKVKVPLGAIPQGGASGKLVVVTAITPTPAGEGKTTTSIGLTDGLARIGKRAVLAIREPSLGPLFGMKGGGTGGGRATVEPAADINLHFTGDFHAIQSTHNFLASMADNAVRSGAIDGFAAGGISWRRVTDAEDRALRRIVTASAGAPTGRFATRGSTSRRRRRSWPSSRSLRTTTTCGCVFRRSSWAGPTTTGPCAPASWTAWAR